MGSPRQEPGSLWITELVQSKKKLLECLEVVFLADRRTLLGCFYSNILMAVGIIDDSGKCRDLTEMLLNVVKGYLFQNYRMKSSAVHTLPRTYDLASSALCTFSSFVNK
jgi:hypothetical protein